MLLAQTGHVCDRPWPVTTTSSTRCRSLTNILRKICKKNIKDVGKIKMVHRIKTYLHKLLSTYINFNFSPMDRNYQLSSKQDRSRQCGTSVNIYHATIAFISIKIPSNLQRLSPGAPPGNVFFTLFYDYILHFQ